MRTEATNSRLSAARDWPIRSSGGVVERVRDVARQRLSSGPGLGGGAAGNARGNRRAPASRRFRVLATLAVIALLVGGIGWLWLRDSSLLAVRSVSVSGLTGPNAGPMQARLTAAAKRMSTLDVSVSKLEQSIAEFPYVQSVQVAVSYPHKLAIKVNETVPIARVTTPSGTAIVDTNGQILNNSVTVPIALPTLKANGLPSGKYLTEPDTVAFIRLLSAAPYALVAKVQTVISTATDGLVVKLRNGPSLYFGNAGAPAAQWQAAVAVLASASSQGAAYIDVSNADRPAAG